MATPPRATRSSPRKKKAAAAAAEEEVAVPAKDETIMATTPTVTASSPPKATKRSRSSSENDADTEDEDEIKRRKVDPSQDAVDVETTTITTTTMTTDQTIAVVQQETSDAKMVLASEAMVLESSKDTVISSEEMVVVKTPTGETMVAKETAMAPASMVEATVPRRPVEHGLPKRVELELPKRSMARLPEEETVVPTPTAAAAAAAASVRPMTTPVQKVVQSVTNLVPTPLQPAVRASWQESSVSMPAATSTVSTEKEEAKHVDLSQSPEAKRKALDNAAGLALPRRTIWKLVVAIVGVAILSGSTSFVFYHRPQWLPALVATKLPWYEAVEEAPIAVVDEVAVDPVVQGEPIQEEVDIPKIIPKPKEEEEEEEVEPEEVISQVEKVDDDKEEEEAVPEVQDEPEPEVEPMVGEPVVEVKVEDQAIDEEGGEEPETEPEVPPVVEEEPRQEVRDEEQPAADEEVEVPPVEEESNEEVMTDAEVLAEAQRRQREAAALQRRQKDELLLKEAEHSTLDKLRQMVKSTKEENIKMQDLLKQLHEEDAVLDAWEESLSTPETLAVVSPIPIPPAIEFKREADDNVPSANVNYINKEDLEDAFIELQDWGKELADNMTANEGALASIQDWLKKEIDLLRSHLLSDASNEISLDMLPMDYMEQLPQDVTEDDTTATAGSLTAAHIRAAVYKRLQAKPRMDYACARNGARVVRSQTSSSLVDTLPIGNRFMHLLGLRFYGHPPEMALLPLSATNKLGQCWAFVKNNDARLADLIHVGDLATLTVTLSEPTPVASVVLEHPPKSDASNPFSAVKTFRVFGYDADDTEYALGSFTYDIENTKSSIQEFHVATTRGRKQQTPMPAFTTIKLAIDSNWGHEYGCLYRFRVHAATTDNDA